MIAKSPNSISRANIEPAIGALNVPAIPAAAPQATKVRNCDPRTFINCPKVDPAAEPICTIGPSRPTEPPEPILIAEANIFAITTLGLITPPLILIDSITSDTPCPLVSLAKK